MIKTKMMFYFTQMKMGIQKDITYNGYYVYEINE